tara:strand:+ start:2127 stop:3812 length:1686 start_codon:yes stop_codon:yes gene_type:complete
VLTIAPLGYAILRLTAVTDLTIVEALGNFLADDDTVRALRFTLLEATFSTIFTIIIGLPIAWYLGRYKWKHIRILRALLSVPFVTPSIVVAMGFLMLIDPDGLLNYAGIDLRLESGIIGDIASYTGWANPGHFIALIAAHVWFNLSLVMRFIEPTLSTMDKSWEEQIRFLPAGSTRFGRVRNLWLPILGPAALCAASLCFIFSFTSFALIKWLTPNQDNLETLMAKSGGSAGIYNYRVDTSEIVLATSIVQLMILCLAILITAQIQRKHSVIHAVVTENSESVGKIKPNPAAKLIISGAVIYSLLPLILVAISSFRIRDISNGDYSYSTEAWQEAWSGNYSATAIPEALYNSLIYCIITLVIALPIGYVISSLIARLEHEGRIWTARVVEVLSMIPLALSAVMIGLGILIGLLKWSPSLFSWILIPAIPHIVITTPFVIRIMLPAMRSLQPEYMEQAKLLGLSTIKSWWHGKILMLRAPLVVSAALTMAFSLGEFGASWILVRSGSWDSLSVLVDQLMGQPKFDPLIQPMAMAAATTLMLLTFVLFLIAEKFRANEEGSGF